MNHVPKRHDVVQWVNSAWKGVSAQYICNTWTHIGFKYLEIIDSLIDALTENSILEEYVDMKPCLHQWSHNWKLIAERWQ